MVEDDQSEVFLKALEADQIVQAATHIQPRVATIPHLEVDRRQCPGYPQEDVVLEVQRYSENKKERVNALQSYLACCPIDKTYS